MKIVQVEYRRLRTFGDYQNETVGAVAEVAQVGETPSMALAALRHWVDEQLGDDDERRKVQQRVSELRWEEDRLKRSVERMQGKWAEIMAFLERFGIERPAEVPGDLAEILTPEDPNGMPETVEGLPF